MLGQSEGVNCDRCWNYSTRVNFAGGLLFNMGIAITKSAMQ
ncbi:hypothetical protein EGJ31_01660 [Serratia marcescens]|nr:hypothetical protein D5R36_13165 [Serratia marcescens]RKM89066.1 hypothetical protein D5R37_07000 [Serratia marcescens]RMW82340.1 hypothetical protein D5R39_04925 [Serratia marcescens]RRU00545.1 hypothetical protein EGI90_04075 [Serratia marcescens]RRU18022.1 hypothetical protein EGJ16_13745 [Serratia marcescens]